MTDDTTDTDQTSIDIDLSTDADADTEPEPEPAPDPATRGDDGSDTQPREPGQAAGDAVGASAEASGADAPADAEELAQRHLQATDGDPDAAIEAVRHKGQQAQRQLQAQRETQRDKQQRRDQLADAYDRVEAQPADAQVLQTLEGGITLEVPTEGETETEVAGGYTRAALLTDIEETREQLGAHLDQLADRIAQCEQTVERAQAAIGHLEQYRQMHASLDT